MATRAMIVIIHLRMSVCGVGAAIAVTCRVRRSCWLSAARPWCLTSCMDATEVADNGAPDNERHHPPEDVSAWCRCGNCRHTPSAAEKLCCKMQPRHCLSQRAELEMLVLDEGVLAVADKLRVDMLAGEVHLDNEGMLRTDNLCCGGTGALGRATPSCGYAPSRYL